MNYPMTTEKYCEFAKEVEKKFGKEALCPFPERKYSKCEAQCAWSAECVSCDERTVIMNDTCFGLIDICINPMCAEDK